MERIRIDRRQTGSRMRRRVRAARDAAAATPLQYRMVGGGVDAGLDGVDIADDAIARIDAVLDAVDTGRSTDPQ